MDAELWLRRSVEKRGNVCNLSHLPELLVALTNAGDITKQYLNFLATVLLCEASRARLSVAPIL